MSLKKLLFLLLVAFLVYSGVKIFKTDTSNPNVVIKKYLEHWISNNTTGMYPLISQRAKKELKNYKVNNVSDYYAYFVEHRLDLTSFDITSQEINATSGRFWINLRALDYTGHEYQENATFYLVKEKDGWRVDSWQRGDAYNLP
jgi:hypothetical protein